MDREIELQIQRILDLVSKEEKNKNRALCRQTIRLIRAILSAKSNPAQVIQIKEVKA